ncbi:MAG: hypothetical protein ACYDB1_00830 [Acidiferrobacteraceae bacterium]
MARNPSVEAPERSVASDYLPMGGPTRQLELPEIEGYVTYWFADRPGRIDWALTRGWEFVSKDEVDIGNFRTIGGSVEDSGSTDLGSRISVHGYEGSDGKSVRLYAMKVKHELWSKLESYREEQSERIAAAVKGHRIGVERETQGDASKRYSPRVGGKTTLFDKKRH